MRPHTLLPLAVWAIAACNDGVRPTATIAAADTADQVLIGMSHYVTEAGVLRARVRADTAYLYSSQSSAQLAELRGVHITFYDVNGNETSTLTAREGTYHWRTGDMEGHGNVVAVGSDGRTLRTEVMRFSQQKNQVSSERPFVFDAPGRHMEGVGFTSDPSFRDVVATQLKGTGGQVTLPKQ